jgi:hypothetical protein
VLTSPAFRRTFDLSSAPAAVRERSGRTAHGQGCLLARRLVESGVRFVTVYFAATTGGQSFVSGGWDTHGFNSNPMYPVLDRDLLPIADHTLPVLPEALDTRGLLEDTVVLWAGESGASPARDPVRPGDLSAALFHLLGIDPHSEVRDPLNRPLPISTGAVINGILAGPGLGSPVGYEPLRELGC